MGDIHNSLASLQSSLRKIKYGGELDVHSCKEGFPEAFLPLVHYTLLGYSRLLAQELNNAGFELFGKSDLKFIEGTYLVLRDVFNYSPKLSKIQFFSVGFSNQKMLLTTDIINLAIKKHTTLAKAQKQPRSPTRRQRHTTNATNTTNTAKAKKDKNTPPQLGRSHAELGPRSDDPNAKLLHHGPINRSMDANTTHVTRGHSSTIVPLNRSASALQRHNAQMNAVIREAGIAVERQPPPLNDDGGDDDDDGDHSRSRDQANTHKTRDNRDDFDSTTHADVLNTSGHFQSPLRMKSNALTSPQRYKNNTTTTHQHQQQQHEQRHQHDQQHQNQQRHQNQQGQHDHEHQHQHQRQHQHQNRLQHSLHLHTSGSLEDITSVNDLTFTDNNNYNNNSNNNSNDNYNNTTTNNNNNNNNNNNDDNNNNGNTSSNHRSLDRQHHHPPSFDVDEFAASIQSVVPYTSSSIRNANTNSNSQGFASRVVDGHLQLNHNNSIIRTPSVSTAERENPIIPRLNDSHEDLSIQTLYAPEDYSEQLTEITETEPSHPQNQSVGVNSDGQRWTTHTLSDGPSTNTSNNTNTINNVNASNNTNTISNSNVNNTKNTTYNGNSNLNTSTNNKTNLATRSIPTHTSDHDISASVDQQGVVTSLERLVNCVTTLSTRINHVQSSVHMEDNMHPIKPQQTNDHSFQRFSEELKTMVSRIEDRLDDMRLQFHELPARVTLMETKMHALEFQLAQQGRHTYDHDHEHDHVRGTNITNTSYSNQNQNQTPSIFTELDNTSRHTQSQSHVRTLEDTISIMERTIGVEVQTPPRPRTGDFRPPSTSSPKVSIPRRHNNDL